jgi:predicted lipoprotein with Yx(FWY)xxD motif
MQQTNQNLTNQNRKTTHRIRVARIAVAAAAVGGLSASVLSVSTAGAVTGRAAKTVSIVKSASFGKILASGRTLYTLKPSKTACTAECKTIWPELVLPAGVTKAKAGSGVNASKLGTVARSGGVLQVTYSGKPLYYFSGDTAAGQVHGNITDVWGKWSVVVTAKAAKSSSNSSSNSGSGSSGTSSGSGGAGF